MPYNSRVTSSGRYPVSIRKKKVVKRAPKRTKLIKFAPGAQYNFRPLNILPRPALLELSHRSKMLYYYNVDNASAGTMIAGAWVFSANGLFDPDITGTTGGQPMGFDQMQLLYEHYTCLGGKITVNFKNESKTEYAYCGIAIAPDATAGTDPYKLVENGMLVRSYVSEGFAGNMKEHCELTLPFNVGRINSRKNIVGDDLYRGDAASNPTEQTYLHVFHYNPNTATTTTLNYDVLIEYDVVWTEPRKLAIS